MIQPDDIVDVIQVCIIASEEIPSWKSALCNVVGVYIIVDIKTGKQHIGNAYGGEGTHYIIWF